jgi:hypothetical protein
MEITPEDHDRGRAYQLSRTFRLKCNSAGTVKRLELYGAFIDLGFDA